MGTSAALLAASGDSFRLPERDVYAPAVAELRDALGSTRYDHPAADGETMPDDAISAAMETVLTAAGTTTLP